MDSDDLLALDEADDESPAADELAPEDEAPPDDDDPEEDAPEDETGDEDEEDPRAEVERLRREVEERDRADRERAERESQEAATRHQQEAQQREAAVQMRRQQAWQTYQGKKAALNQQRIEDAKTVAESGDPVTTARFLAAERARQEQAVDAEYWTWKAQDDQAEQYALRTALERASAREYADYVRNAYQLPHDSLNEIMTYASGRPVAATDFPDRAAEIYERRKTDANRKRAETRKARQQAQDAVRADKGAVPGRGQGPGGKELEGSLEELNQFWPLRRLA